MGVVWRIGMERCKYYYGVGIVIGGDLF